MPTVLPTVSPSLRATFRSDWMWLLAGALLCFVVASVLLSGWPTGLVPNLTYPFTYAGDGISHSWMAKRAMEGWVFQNPRSGYPFGSNFLDYPGSDSGNLLILKVLAMFTHGYQGALNLYVLLGFSVTFVTACTVMRALGLARSLAIAGAILYAFAPFHFQRIGHLFYTWYFVAPLFFYATVKLIAQLSSTAWVAPSRTTNVVHALALVAMGCFGVYYAIFGMILLALAALAGIASGRPGRAVVARAVLAICFVAGGVFLNIVPNVVYQHQFGPNHEVAQRNAADAEVYGMKMTQLFLPRPDHMVPALAKYTNDYMRDFPLINENYTANLGIVGSIGFVAALLAMFALAIGRRVTGNIRVIAMMTIVLFLFGTIGAFGSLFAQFISPSIRGWNRISIFLSFGASCVFFLSLQHLVLANRPRKIALAAGGVAAVLVLAAGMFDQSAPACIPCNLYAQQSFDRDRNFVATLEQMLPPKSAIYQLPYMEFPEVPPRFELETYGLATGFLHSKALRWSYAGMRGRAGDLFFRSLSKQPPARQIEVLRRLGFRAIYIDLRGYEDKGVQIVRDFSSILEQAPILQRSDGRIVVFSLGDVPEETQRRVTAAHSADELMIVADYVADRLGKRYNATFAQGIDFTREDFPSFVADVTGLGGPNPFGRWSDQSLGDVVRIDFKKPLPQHFTLALKAVPFGPNADKDLTIRIGTQVLRVRLKAGEGAYRLPVDLGSEQVMGMAIVPAMPISPFELKQSGDTRKFGVGLIRLAFE